MDRPCAMKTLPGISAFLEQRRAANWKPKLKCPPRDFHGSPIHPKPPNVTLPSSAMKQIYAITIARLVSLGARFTTPRKRTSNRDARSNDWPIRMTVPVRMISVSRETRVLHSLRRLLDTKVQIVGPL